MTDDARRLRLAIVVFAVPWVLLFWQLSFTWGALAQYSFGWLMPPLFAFVLWKRWAHRPTPNSAHPLAALAQWSSGLVLLPLWFFLQPSPDWRLLNWAFALTTLIFSASLCLRGGGRTWLLHFLPALLLPLAAVPWPMNFENRLMQILAHAVTFSAVDLLNFIGVPALQYGNVVDIGSGLLGVDEACSGIRSLQASLMAALVLGEVFQAKLGGRIVLVLSGAGLALFSNVLRTVFLAWTAAHSGIHAMEQWHDAAGLSVLTLCLLGLLAVALQLPQKNQPPPAVRSYKVDFGNAGLLVLWVVTLIFTEFWFRHGTTEAQKTWGFSGPKSGFHTPKIPRQSAEQLLYDKATTASWNPADGTRWAAFFFQWNAGTARSRILARMHKPEACLPASGYVLKSHDPIVNLEAGDLLIPFRALTFEGPSGPMHVFYCVWESGSAIPSNPSIERACLEAALRGQRRLGQQVLQVAVVGYASATEAAAAFVEQIPSMIELRKGR